MPSGRGTCSFLRLRFEARICSVLRFEVESQAKVAHGGDVGPTIRASRAAELGLGTLAGVSRFAGGVEILKGGRHNPAHPAGPIETRLCPGLWAAVFVEVENARCILLRLQRLSQGTASCGKLTRNPRRKPLKEPIRISPRLWAGLEGISYCLRDLCVCGRVRRDTDCAARVRRGRVIGRITTRLRSCSGLVRGGDSPYIENPDAKHELPMFRGRMSFEACLPS